MAAPTISIRGYTLIPQGAAITVCRSEWRDGTSLTKFTHLKMKKIYSGELVRTRSAGDEAQPIALLWKQRLSHDL